MPMKTVLSIVCLLALGLAGTVANAAPDEGPAAKVLESAWSLDGSWSGVVGDDDQGVIFALGSGGKCFELDSAGKTRRDFRLPRASGSVLRLGTWSGEGGRALLVFGVWTRELQAYDLDGKPLWAYPVSSGIDDVWAMNLPGGKSGDVVVGYNGGTGVHVLDSKGQLVWKSNAIGNVWHVCAGDVWGEGTSQIVTTSAVGKVHVFGSDGKKRTDLDAGCYANMVRVGKLADKDATETIFVAGSSLKVGDGQKTAIVAALSGTGDRKWLLEVSGGVPSHIDSAALAPGVALLAVGMRDGKVHVIDARNGAIISSVDDQGMAPEVGWITKKIPRSPLLLVATGNKLNAFGIPNTK